MRRNASLVCRFDSSIDSITPRSIDISKKLTTAAGCPIVDNQNTMTAGPRGSVLLQDVWLLEKLAHFDREVIPERRMHAKGSAAYGKGIAKALGIDLNEINGKGFEV